MLPEELAFACCTDFAGKVRGKAFPADEFEKRMRRGVGWTPTNVQITCFDGIAESPYGSLGDLVLLLDPAARVRLELGGEVEHFALGDIRHTDGRPWECCTRTMLKDALARLERVGGLTLFGAFEHEFQFAGEQAGDEAAALGDAFGSQAFRSARPFLGELFAAMRGAGLQPDTTMKEFGARQYEVTMGPTAGVAIADQAAILRELVRAVSGRHGRRATFSPITDPAGVGNGVHIHLSFRRDGEPATYDPAGRHEMTETAGQFAAGVLKYLDAIVALTAPSAVSYLRLTPHRWSAAFNNLGFRDREAALRICPVSDISDVARASQFNMEFRAADAAASPHLQLAAIVHAGAQGIEEALPVPDATTEDLSLLDAQALAARGLVRLPRTLAEALERFEASRAVAGWFPQGFQSLYAAHKRGEMAFLEGRSQEEACALYARTY